MYCVIDIIPIHTHTHTHIHTSTCAFFFSLASVDLNAESSSLGDIAEESDLEVYSDVNMATEKGGSSLKGSAQAEKEIRYY